MLGWGRCFYNLDWIHLPHIYPVCCPPNTTQLTFHINLVPATQPPPHQATPLRCSSKITSSRKSPCTPLLPAPLIVHTLFELHFAIYQLCDLESLLNLYGLLVARLYMGIITPHHEAVELVHSTSSSAQHTALGTDSTSCHDHCT